VGCLSVLHAARHRSGTRASHKQLRPASSRLACAVMFAPTWWRVLQPAFDVETEAPCGTSVAEAREALAFWRQRLKRLPWIAAPPAPKHAR
jgi:hypothetical protein